MSRESRELHGYQIRCAEQQGLIEQLENEVGRLNAALKIANQRNQRLLSKLIGPNPFTGHSGQPETDTSIKKDGENKGPNEVQSSEEKKPPEDNTSDESQDAAEEPFDIEKFIPECSVSEFKSYKEQISHECQEFLKKYSFSDFYTEISKEIIGQDAGLGRILAVIYNYIYTLASGERPEKCTAVMLTAPSGNGKSALFKSLSEFFRAALPSLVCSRKDAGKLVPMGYRGATVNSVLSEFVSHDKYRNEQKYGILWLDEFDKVRFNPDCGPQVQNQLLTYMDGIEETYGNTSVDTQCIFWIASGSFNDVRQKKKRKAQKNIGFVSVGNKYDAFDEITREDMLQIFSYEIIGRFCLVVSFGQLSEEAVISIIMKMLEDIYKDLHLDILVSKEYVDVLIQSANTEFGCRQIYSTLYEICLQAYIDIMRGEVYGIDDHPTVIIEGPENYIIVDEATADQIRYDDKEGKYM